MRYFVNISLETSPTTRVWELLSLQSVQVQVVKSCHKLSKVVISCHKLSKVVKSC